MINNIIELKGRLTYLLYTTNYNDSAFFASKKICCASCLFIGTLSNLFLLQKERRGPSTSGRNNKAREHILKEFSNVDAQTTGEAEE
jgi:hypothetical protein